MAARAWRGRKPGPWRAELRWAQATARALRNPGRHVRTPGGLIIFDEIGIPGYRDLPVRKLDTSDWRWT